MSHDSSIPRSSPSLVVTTEAVSYALERGDQRGNEGPNGSFALDFHRLERTSGAFRCARPGACEALPYGE